MSTMGLWCAQVCSVHNYKFNNPISPFWNGFIPHIHIGFMALCIYRLIQGDANCIIPLDP